MTIDLERLNMKDDINEADINSHNTTTAGHASLWALPCTARILQTTRSPVAPVRNQKILKIDQCEPHHIPHLAPKSILYGPA